MKFLEEQRAKNEKERQEEVAAATKIQARTRGKLARGKESLQRKSEKAVEQERIHRESLLETKVQARLSRLPQAQELQGVQEESDRESLAATAIQARIRGKQARASQAVARQAQERQEEESK